jgi:hypothetical protein
MRYYVTVNKKYRYIKVFSILKKISESTNPVSRAFESFVGKLSKKKVKAEE